MDSPIALVVAGAPRSGTSALTGLLTTLGCTPPRDPHRATQHNPKGYFESEAFIYFLDRVLLLQGSSELDWRPLDPKWSNTPDADRLIDEGCSLLLEKFGGAPLIAFKNPRIAKLIPFIQKMASRAGYEARYVIAFRNPLEVARSEVLHHELGLREAELIWLRYALDAEKYSRGLKRCFVAYQRTLQDWRNVVVDVERQLNLRLFARSPDIVDAVDRFITTDLWRQRDLPDAGSAPSCSPWSLPIYRALINLQADPHCLQSCDILDAFGREFSWAVETFSPMIAPQRQAPDAWTSYMPVVQSSSGSLQALESAGRYRLDGKSVFINFKILISLNGSAGDVLSISLPENCPARAPTALIGRERTEGKILQGIIDGPRLSVFRSDNAYPGFDGAEITMSGLYESI